MVDLIASRIFPSSSMALSAGRFESCETMYWPKAAKRPPPFWAIGAVGAAGGGGGGGGVGDWEFGLLKARIAKVEAEMKLFMSNFSSFFFFLVLLVDPLSELKKLSSFCETEIHWYMSRWREANYNLT